MWSGTLASTKNVVDTRNYKKMCVSISSICLETSSYYDSNKLGITNFIFGLSNNAGVGITSSPSFLVEEQLKSPSDSAQAKFTTAGTYTLDISQFQGNYFVLLRLVTSTWYEQMGDIQIERIWLE